MIRFASISQSIRKKFFDTFNRANQTGIGTASDGSIWQTIRGSFNITSNKADGQTPSNYPIIAVDMPKEAVTINLSGVTQGSTAALWVTDSGNWYGIGIDQESVSCNCQTCSTPGNCASYYYQCNAVGYPCNATSYYCDVVGNRYCRSWSTVCNAMFGPSCTAWSRPCTGYNSGNCNATNSMTNCNAYGTVCNSASYPCGSYNATTYYSCNCQTCYPQYIRFIQSVSNVVSQLTSWTVANVIQSFKVIVSAINPQKTSATTTIKPYSDANLSSQIGSDLTYTPTGVAINAKYGIMVKPSSYSQGTTIEEISIETT